MQRTGRRIGRHQVQRLTHRHADGSSDVFGDDTDCQEGHSAQRQRENDGDVQPGTLILPISFSTRTKTATATPKSAASTPTKDTMRSGRGPELITRRQKWDTSLR